MKTPINGERLRNHLTYSWWKYILLVILAFACWDIIYNFTRPQVPEDKKIVLNLYVYGDSDALGAYMAQINETLMPEMEEMSVSYNVLVDSSADLVLTAHVTVREGDIYLLSRDYFQRYASTGIFLPLEADEELMATLEASGISLSQGWRTLTGSGERHLFGVPCVNLPGITAYLYDPTDCYLCVLADNGNEENVARFFRILMADLLEKPQPTEE